MVEMVLTESQAEGQLGSGHPQSQGQSCFPQSFGFFPGKPETCARSPRGLLATPCMQVARAGRPPAPTQPHSVWSLDPTGTFSGANVRVELRNRGRWTTISGAD